MSSVPRKPLDPFPYRRDSRSRLIDSDLADGSYVYVRNEQGQIFVLPDGPHRHPRVLGGGAAALYAGDLRIEAGVVTELTNLSGTFQFDDAHGLLEVAALIRAVGLTIEPGRVRLFPNDGARPIILE
jgi:hypothetical protein